MKGRQKNMAGNKSGGTGGRKEEAITINVIIVAFVWIDVTFRLFEFICTLIQKSSVFYGCEYMCYFLHYVQVSTSNFF